VIGKLRAFVSTAAVLVTCLSAGERHGLAQANAPLYRATVSVVDNRGNPVKGLTADDFVVTIGDVPRGASSVDVDPRPLSIVVIVDGTEVSEVLQVRGALTAVLKQLRRGGADVRIGLILGEEGAREPRLENAQSAASDHDRRASRFFQAPQTAPPFDTIEASVAALQKEEGRRRAVLLLSVNRRLSKHQYLEGLVTAVRRADITLAIVETGLATHVASAVGATSRSQDQSVWLIHTAVGGVYVRGIDASALGPMGSRLAGGLTSAYQVTFAASETTDLPMKVTVKGRDRLTVIAPSWALR
jgi:hypothetical protein